MPSFDDIADLIARLRSRDAMAADQFCEWIRPELETLKSAFLNTHPELPPDTIIVDNLLGTLKVRVITAPTTELAPMLNVARARETREVEFRNYIMVYSMRVLWGPFDAPDAAFRASDSDSNGNEAVQDQSHQIGDFSIRTYVQQKDAVGGDLILVTAAEDGTMWIIVADVTSHGLPAHLLREGLPDLWTMCLADRPESPKQMLRLLSEPLHHCLPDGWYVEATVSKLHRSGQAVFAGRGPVFFRRSAEKPADILHLGGLWLGVDPEEEYEEASELLPSGGEFAFCSDGVLEQTYTGRIQHVFPEVPPRHRQHNTLRDFFRDLIAHCLREHEQGDDISFVWVGREVAA